MYIPLDIILPEIYSCIVGFSCTVWTKTRYLAGSLDDGVLADDIKFFFPPTDTAYYNEGKGSSKKSTETSNRKTIY